MSDNSAIEWTDATWNPVTGCTKVSRGCDHCYAETFAERWRGTPGHHFKNGFDVTLRPERLDQPLRWKKPRRIFVNSMSDLFHEQVPDDFIVTVFARMWWSPQHTFQVLTKRHGRMRSLVPRIEERLREMECDLDLLDAPTPLRWPLPNVWLGVSVEDQKRADLRIPALLDTPVAVRFLSCEPLLGPIDLHANDSRTFEPQWLPPVAHGVNAPDARAGDGSSVGDLYASMYGPNIDWVIVGGESGPGARPMAPAWARQLRDQCTTADVPYFFKQWGAWEPTGKVGLGGTLPGETRVGDPVDEHGFRVEMRRTRKKSEARELDGQTWDQYPAVTS